MEQIFNVRVLCEKYSQHQQDIYHVFIDFKKAFDRVRPMGNNEEVQHGTEAYKYHQAAVYKGQQCSTCTRDCGRLVPYVGRVRQGCLLSPTLFNIFLKGIMIDALEDHHGTVSIGGQTITNLRFADDIDGLAGEEEELASLVNRLDTTSFRYGMEISAEKTKLMTNSTTPIERKITVSGQELQTVTQFKYLGAILNEEGSKTEVLARTALGLTLV